MSGDAAEAKAEAVGQAYSPDQVIATIRYITGSELLIAHFEGVLGLGGVPSMADIMAVLCPAPNKSINNEQVQQVRDFGRYLVDVGTFLAQAGASQ